MKRTKRFLSLALAAIMVLSMNITAMAASTNVAISADYNGDGTADFSWTLPGVVKTEKMTMGNATELDVERTPYIQALVDKEVTVYTVPVGTAVSVVGARGITLLEFEHKNEKLCQVELENSTVYKNNLKWRTIEQAKGYRYDVTDEGSYVSYIKEGYYVIEIKPFVPQMYETALNADFALRKDNTDFIYGGYAILHVVSAETAAALAAEAPAVSTTPAASALTVEQIQKRFDGWYSNDLVAVNAAQGQNTVKTTVTNPVFISYNATANTVATLSDVQYTVSNGSITFTAPASGIIVISEGKLAK